MLLNSQGLDTAAASSGLANYNLGGVLGVLIWAVLTTARGSRGPLLWCAAGAAATALAVMTVPAGARPLLMAALGLHGLLANALQTSLYSVAAHVYPTRIRASGVACASALGRAGGILSSLFGSAIIAAGAGAYWTFLAAAMICAFAGVALVKHHIPASKVRAFA